MISRLAALFLVVGMSPAQTQDSRMDQVVQSYVASKEFMGSVLVARGNDILLSKGYGSANLEWGIPNTPSTKFRLGSITKQFTAASILLLEERGKLKVEDLVKQHLRDAPAAWDKVTIFHLLTHTAGVPSFTDFPDYKSFQPFATTTEKLVARFRDKPLDFEPGQNFYYSNSGYVLLGHLIEKISGQSYERFVQENIFTPLGMKDSGYDSNSAVIARRAAGYTPAPNGPVNADFLHMSVPHAAGALYSTTEDLLRWEQGLFGGKLLSAASLAKMTTPLRNNYAFGLAINTVSGRKVISHGGGIEGFNTMLAYFPETKLTVAVLANLNGFAPDPIETLLARLAHGETVVLPSERKEITLDPKVLSRFIGVYQMAPGTNMLITLENNQLMSQLTGQGAIPIFARSESVFFPRVVDAELEFCGSDAQARATQLTLRQNGRDMPARRLPDGEFERLSNAAALATQRAKEQTPAPGSEAALRRLIQEIRSGNPSYDRLTPAMADVTRQHLPQLQASLKQLGEIQKVAFKEVGPGGDAFRVDFESGAMEFRIRLDPDGQIDGASMRPAN
jgi:CubicO group peptidase (beta-lactamase class C family)